MSSTVVNPITKQASNGIFFQKHRKKIIIGAIAVVFVLIVLGITGKLTPTKKEQKTTNGAPSSPTEVASSIKTPSTKSTYAIKDDISDTGLFISFKSPLQSGIENNTNINYYLIQIIKEGEEDINYIKSGADGGPLGSQFNTSISEGNNFKWKADYRGGTTGGIEAELFLSKNAIGITETGSYKIKVQAANDNNLLSAAAYSSAIEYDVCQAGNANACGWTDNSWTGGLTYVVEDRYVPEALAASETGAAGVDVQYAKPAGQVCEPLTKEPNTLYKYDDVEQCVAAGCVSSDFYLEGTKCLRQPAEGLNCTIGDNKVSENVTGNIFYKIPPNVDGGGENILVCDSTENPQDPRIGCNSMAIPEGSGIASWSLNKDTGNCVINCDNENYKPNADNTACEPKTCAVDGETVVGGRREGSTYPDCNIICDDTYNALMDDAGSTTIGCQLKTCEEVNGQIEGGTWSGNITENNCTLACGPNYNAVTNGEGGAITACQPKTCTDENLPVEYGTWSGDYPTCQINCNDGYTLASDGVTCEQDVVEQVPSCTPESFSEKVATVDTTDGGCSIASCKRPYRIVQGGRCGKNLTDPVYWSKTKIADNDNNIVHESDYKNGLYVRGSGVGKPITEKKWGGANTKNNRVWFGVESDVNDYTCATKCLDMDACKAFQIRRELQGTINNVSKKGNECRFFNTKNTAGKVNNSSGIKSASTYNRRNVVMGDNVTNTPVGADTYINPIAGLNAASRFTDY